MNQVNSNKSYATFGLGRSWRQFSHALESRRHASENMLILSQMLRTHEKRMQAALGRPLKNLHMLEIGPGQGMERACYFGIHNEVVGFDLDVIPQGINPSGYWHMLRTNGFGRFAKTIGRKLIVGRANLAAWKTAVGATAMPTPKLIQGDICQNAPEVAAYDVVMSWSVFEHLPNPRQALANVIQCLRPGGIFYLSLHLITSHNGHHDIRAFTGDTDPALLWGHLRASTQHTISPSSYLNAWRLSQWRDLFNDLAPSHTEFLESYDCKAQYGSLIDNEFKHELEPYTEEELLTVDVIYLWQKPTDTRA